MATIAGSFVFKVHVKGKVIHLENVSFINYDFVNRSSELVYRSSDLFYSDFHFPRKKCQKQQNIEYLKIETPRCTKKNTILTEPQKGNTARNISSLFNAQRK